MKTKIPTKDWSNFLLALTLAFVVALSPILDRIYSAFGLLASGINAVEIVMLTVGFWLVLPTWRQVHELRRRRAATAFALSQLARFSAFVLVIGVGVWWIYLMFGNLFQSVGFWGLAAADLLVFGFLFRGATAAADITGDAIWRDVQVLKLRAPDGAAFVALKQAFVLGKASFDGRCWVAMLAALGAVCLLIHAILTLMARTASVAAPAPTWAIFGMVSLGCALRLWWECVPLARIDNAEIRPRFGRAFRWFDIARIEEARIARFMGSDQRYLIFRDQAGAILGQLWLDNLEWSDKRELWRFFPETAKTDDGNI